VPVDALQKPAAFQKIGALCEEARAELIVLARYMQILPAALCEKYAGKIINIHHSFLPSFVGANPYQQAYERGVKLIGATCHYATAELDAGPIIDQEVVRVEHFHSPADLLRHGRDCERLALARGVRYHIHDRVLIHGTKAIVFRD
jgi:formyltetrahydrofolate deformylase